MPQTQPRAATVKHQVYHSTEDLTEAIEAKARETLLRPISNLQAVTLLVLLSQWVEVVELNLSPVYGSIPAAGWRGILGSGVCIAGVATSLGASISATAICTLFDWIPLIALGSAWSLHAYLYQASSRLGPVWGPFFTKAIVQVPLLLISGVVLASLLKRRNRSLPWLMLIGIPWLFKPNALMDLLSLYLGSPGSSILLTRHGLLVALTLCFSVVCPPIRSRGVCIRWISIAVLTISFFLIYDEHGPSLSSLGAANRRLWSSGYVILERKESITGYISVLEDKQRDIRALRCDHSLLGGTWLVNEIGIQHGMTQPETLFSVFVMLEAVRLMVPIPVDQTRSTLSHFQNALVIGLGIGTSPTAFFKHGINTTVVEIDPAVTHMARKYFELPDEISVHDEDALSFVAKSSRLTKRYDFIVHDVFTGGAEPVSLFTVEFLRMLKDLLTPSGSVAVNYGGDLKRESTWRILNTIAAAFGNCKAYRDNEPAKGSQHDFANFIVFCKPGHSNWTFRKPVEADFLGSLARRTSLTPQLEINLELTEPANVLSSSDPVSQQLIDENQKRSAADHWRIMRGLMPDIVWETW